MESCRDTLFDCRVGQQVAGDLLNRELIERHVAIESIDHPVAITPRIQANAVLLVTIAVRIAGEIQPVAAPFFAVMRRGEQTIDQPLLGLRRPIVQKGLDFRRRRQETGQIEGNATDQCPCVRFR